MCCRTTKPDLRPEMIRATVRAASRRSAAPWRHLRERRSRGPNPTCGTCERAVQGGGSPGEKAAAFDAQIFVFVLQVLVFAIQRLLFRWLWLPRHATRPGGLAHGGGYGVG